MDKVTSRVIVGILGSVVWCMGMRVAVDISFGRCVVSTCIACARVVTSPMGISGVMFMIFPCKGIRSMIPVSVQDNRCNSMAFQFPTTCVYYKDGWVYSFCCQSTILWKWSASRLHTIMQYRKNSLAHSTLTAQDTPAKPPSTSRSQPRPSTPNPSFPPPSPPAPPSTSSSPSTPQSHHPHSRPIPFHPSPPSPSPQKPTPPKP